MDAHNTYWFTRLRLGILFLAIVFCRSNFATAAGPTAVKEPETVYVGVEQTRLYAGPSNDFYPTGNVNRGAALEVHHRTNNGWLGVRPPQGSFSWVPAAQAYLLPGGRVIEITESSAVSWIGTEFGSAKQYRWQVQLNVGEQLGVLGEASVKNGSDEREALWYKVSPPAGEFRWIEESAVSKTPVQPSTKIVDDSTQVATAEASADTAAKDANRVQQASFNETPNRAPSTGQVQPEQSVAPERKSKSSAAQPASRRAASTKKPSNNSSAKPNSEWDGWYAFEVSDDGVKTPFLDKLSGRDRGQSAPVNKPKSTRHDPLVHDPFSLSMAGEADTKPNPTEVTNSIRKSREWRDPRSLRDARLAGNNASSPSLPLENFVDRFDRAVAGVSGVLPASAQQPVLDNNYQAPIASDSSSANSAASSANVNWYGLSEASGIGNDVHRSPTSAINASPTNAMNVVTNPNDVAELQVALNNAVANSEGPWNLAPLAERAKYFVEHGATAIDRGQARLLLERIEAFQSVSVRSQQLAGPQLPGQPPVQSPVQSASYASSTPSANDAAQPSVPTFNYDATGWLVPVHSASPDQPTHAITNDTGDIVAYVSPIAGLNLDRYRNQAVGITGLRGYLPQLQAAHIQAQRVSRIR